jgi:hypothetical protein
MDQKLWVFEVIG